MEVITAELVKMGTDIEHFPEDNLPEVMLSGRSNVGKSSFINTLTNRKKLAYTSSQPGKTQTLNFYLINERLYLVDVPGYGYARVSQKQRLAFGQMIEQYIQNREQLKLAVLLVDFRHPPTEDDVLMYNYYKHFQIPVLVVATKSDKVRTTHRKRHERIIRESLNLQKSDPFVCFSSVTKEGQEDVWRYITQVL